MMLIHSHVNSNQQQQPPSYLQNVVPVSDMIEIAHDPFPSGIAYAKQYGPKPECRFVAYKHLMIHLGTDKDLNFRDMAPSQEAAFLHHKDGTRWDLRTIGYQPGAPIPIHLLNPRDPVVTSDCLMHLGFMKNLGYSGYRFDEAIVGWGPHNSVAWEDCKEYTSAALYLQGLVVLMGKLRAAVPGFLLLPSIMQVEWWSLPTIYPLIRACRGVAAENLPAGNGTLDPVPYADVDRTIAGIAGIFGLLRQSSYPLTAMVYAQFRPGLDWLHAAVNRFTGSQVFVNVDKLRRPDGTFL